MAGGALLVEDDGPGMIAVARQTAARRGVRFDERGSSGLGLAIASEILAVYGWALILDKSDLGGLSVALTSSRVDEA